MDFYKRKEKAILLIKTMLANKKNTIDSIIFAVEDAFHFSAKWTEQQIERLKGK